VHSAILERRCPSLAWDIASFTSDGAFHATVPVQVFARFLQHIYLDATFGLDVPQDVHIELTRLAFKYGLTALAQASVKALVSSI
jgi:hypothetical protein